MSQWEHGKMFPRIPVLVRLAQLLEHSLDYLILGKETRPWEPLDLGPWAGFVDKSLHRLLSKTDERSAATERLTRLLVERLDEVAEEVVERYYRNSEVGAAIPGANLLKDEETMVLESMSLETNLLLLSLDLDIEEERSLGLDSRGPGGLTAAGRFLPIVGANLRQNRPYTFVLPQGARNWEPVVNQYRALLQKWGVPAGVVASHCRFFTTTVPVAGGCGLYRLDPAAFQDNVEMRIFFERIRNLVDSEHWLGYSPPPSRNLRADALMDQEHLRQARTAFAAILKHPGTKQI